MTVATELDAIRETLMLMKCSKPEPKVPAKGADLANSGISAHSRSERFLYRARARTSVTSSGCSLSPIQSSTAEVTV